MEASVNLIAQRNLLNRFVTICGGIVFLFGVAGMFGWIFHIRVLTSVFPNFLPIAPDTTIALIILSSLLLIFSRTFDNHPPTKSIVVITILTSVYGLYRTIFFFADCGLSIEHDIYPSAIWEGRLFLRRMSPVTGLIVFLSGSSLMLILGKKNHRMRNNYAGIIGAVVLFLGFLSTLGYAYGAPILYGGLSCPQAATTAFASVFLGCGIVLSAGAGNIVVRPFVGSSVQARLLRTFLPLSVAAVLAQGLLQQFLSNIPEIHPALPSAMVCLLITAITGAAVVYRSRIINSGVVRSEQGRMLVENELRASQKQLRDLASYLHTVLEEERKSVAREIHDELAQILTAMKIDLNWIEGKLSDQQEQVKVKVIAMREHIERIILSVKRIIGELRPQMLDDLGLLPAIEWHIGELNKRGDLICRLSTNCNEIEVDHSRMIAIYRVFQEALNNVTRHANAKEVRVEIVVADDWLTLNVIDDGVGISDAAIADPKAFGLIGMKERAIAFGGMVEIKKRLGKGCVVSLRIPLAETMEVAQ